MTLYRYTGPSGRVFPAVPVTPEPGDVVDWRDLSPDPLCWEPAPKAKAVRPNDNAAPEAPAEPAPAAPIQE